MPVKTNNAFLLEVHRETARGGLRWMEDSAELPVTPCSLAINFSSTLNAYSSYAGQHTHAHTHAQSHAQAEECIRTHVATSKSTRLLSSSWKSARTLRHIMAAAVVCRAIKVQNTESWDRCGLDVMWKGHGQGMCPASGNSRENDSNHCCEWVLSCKLVPLGFFTMSILVKCDVHRDTQRHKFQDRREEMLLLPNDI